MGKFEQLLRDRLNGTLEASRWNTAATKAGYWIEEDATHFTTPANPLPGVDELGWKYQVAAGKTRPDIELLWNVDGSIRRVGWIDITSSNQVGHIFKKASSLWGRGLDYVCEVYYPSIDFLALGVSIDALGHDPSKVPATQDAVRAQVAEYNRKRDEERARQQEWAGALSTLGRAILNHAEIVRSKRKDAMRKAMCGFLDVSTTELLPKDAASVLLAAGLVPLNYGWDTKTGTTAQDGWNWLRSHNLFTPADARDISDGVNYAVTGQMPGSDVEKDESGEELGDSSMELTDA